MQVELAKHQNRVIEKGVTANQALTHSIKYEPLMIVRKQTTGKPVVHGKERQMLVIKVIF